MMVYLADEAPVSDETFRPPAKPFSSPGEALRKRATSINGLGQQRGSIMWAFILNSIYREILRTSLSGMHKFAAD